MSAVCKWVCVISRSSMPDRIRGMFPVPAPGEFPQSRIP